jgi:hypothetical protein
MAHDEPELPAVDPDEAGMVRLGCVPRGAQRDDREPPSAYTFLSSPPSKDSS